MAASDLIELIAKKAETPFYEDGIDDAEEWAAFRELLREGIAIAVDDTDALFRALGATWVATDQAGTIGYWTTDPFKRGRSI